MQKPFEKEILKQNIRIRADKRLLSQRMMTVVIESSKKNPRLMACMHVNHIPDVTPII